MLRTGVDIIEIERVTRAIAGHGNRFLERVFTVEELAYCDGAPERLAARFAAKEAIAKALGTGIWRDGIVWTDLEVVRNAKSGEPRVRLHNAAARRAQLLNVAEWSLSMSHSRSHAVAFVVAMGNQTLPADDLS